MPPRKSAIYLGAFLDNNSELTYNEGKDFRGVLLTLSDNSGIIRICRGLAQLATKRDNLPAKKHGNIPM